MLLDKNAIEKIVSKIDEEKPLSGVISVIQQDHIVFNQAYGFANRSERIDNNIHTKFGMASGCKGFTAVAIAQLVDKDLLSFNSLLKEYVGIHNLDETITIHDLLTHSSGVPDYFDEEVMKDYSELWLEKPMYTMKKPSDFMCLINNRTMDFKPGSSFKYNNMGFIILGMVIEKITGISFTEYVQKNILEPCGMDSTGYFYMNRLPQNTAYGYLENEQGGWETNIYSIPIVGGPDGGAFTTVMDMTKFWKALIGNKLLSKEITKTMLTPQIHVEEEVFYGYGIWINKREDKILKYHLMGGDPGVSFRSSYYPELALEITVLANKEYGGYAVTKAIEKYLGI